MNTNFELNNLTSEELEQIKTHLKIQGKNINDVIESHLKKILFYSKNTFKELEDWNCPSCFLTKHKEIKLKGIPILEAEKLGLIKLTTDDYGKKFIKENNTHYAVCPVCFWSGIPDVKNNY